MVFTRHAQQRMAQRGVDETLALAVLETGQAKWKDAIRLWVYQDQPDPRHGIVCIVAVLEQVVVVKTVLLHFVPEEP